ncbi:mucin-17-like [Paramacrobiotus metropolitanus]|uniref:mucin-17-like n=1 Tax=Paramacrobiotus metropolitanus TaxID=2943436 RepID=UPI00244573B9|nr:mucin-17-like [Paramacrobiotus metropolitanus]
MILQILFLFVMTFSDAQYVFDLYKNQPALQAAEVSKILSDAVPGVSYPALAQIPATDFSCDKMNISGFFADTSNASRCQVFHRCDINGLFTSYLCPNGTLFSQILLTCDYFFNVDCESEVKYRDYANSRLYKPGVALFDSPPADYVSNISQSRAVPTPVSGAMARADTGEVRSFPAKIITVRGEAANTAATTASPQPSSVSKGAAAPTPAKFTGNSVSLVTVPAGMPRPVREEVDVPATTNTTERRNITSGLNSKSLSEQLLRSKDLLLDAPYQDADNLTLVNVTDHEQTDNTTSGGLIGASGIVNTILPMTTPLVTSTFSTVRLRNDTNTSTDTVLKVTVLPATMISIANIATAALNTSMVASTRVMATTPVVNETTGTFGTSTITMTNVTASPVIMPSSNATAVPASTTLTLQNILLPELAEFGLMNETVTQAIPAEWDNVSANLNPPVEHMGFPEALSLRSKDSPDASGSTDVLGDGEVAPNITLTGNSTGPANRTGGDTAEIGGNQDNVVSSAVISDLEKSLTTVRGAVVSDMPTSTIPSSPPTTSTQSLLTSTNSTGTLTLAQDSHTNSSMNV